MRSRVGLNDSKNVENCGSSRFDNDEIVHVINFQDFLRFRMKRNLVGLKKFQIGI